MTATFIIVDTTKRLGAELRSVVDQLRQAKERLGKFKTIMETQADGADFSLVASQFGVESANGETIYNLVSGTVAALAAFDPTSMTNRLG